MTGIGDGGKQNIKRMKNSKNIRNEKIQDPWKKSLLISAVYAYAYLYTYHMYIHKLECNRLVQLTKNNQRCWPIYTQYDRKRCQG